MFASNTSVQVADIKLGASRRRLRADPAAQHRHQSPPGCRFTTRVLLRIDQSTRGTGAIHVIGIGTNPVSLPLQRACALASTPFLSKRTSRVKKRRSAPTLMARHGRSATDSERQFSKAQRPRGSDNRVRRNHWAHGHSRVALNRQLDDRCQLARSQFRQQNSPTIGEFDGVMVEVGVMRVHLAEAHELARRLTEEPEDPAPDDVPFKR
jgi:hypothetical protein